MRQDAVHTVAGIVAQEGQALRPNAPAKVPLG